VRAVDSIGLKPVIDRRYRFEEADQAFAHLDRGPFGKVVIEFSPSLKPPGAKNTPGGRAVLNACTGQGLCRLDGPDTLDAANDG
jgi:hypothetical protein